MMPSAVAAAAPAASTTASAPTAPTSSSATVSAAISSAVSTAVKPRTPVTTWARRIIPHRVVRRSKILRCGSVRIRLAFFLFGAFRLVMRLFAAGIGILPVATFLVGLQNFTGKPLLVVRLLVMNFAGVPILMAHRCGKGFAGQDFDRRAARAGSRRYGRLPRCMAVIVVLEVFENVADVEKRVAIQANVHECGLHAG